jgi:hypothetical protein
MICGRNPWKTAEPQDECFAAFLADNDFLSRVLPISNGANRILKRCFKLHPLGRPSIAQIREEVLKIDTFFLTEKELAAASSAQRAMAQYYAAPVPKNEFSSDSESAGTLVDNPNANSSVTSVDSEEVYLYSTPQIDSEPWQLAPPADVDSSSAGQSEASSDSGADSSGPLTPASHAVDLATEVPDLPEGQNIDESVTLAAPDAPKPTQISVAGSPVTEPTLKPRGSLFKRVVNHFKVIAN